MIEIKESRSDVLATIASDKLTKEDYDYIIPHLEEKLKNHDKIRWFFEMENFKGWELKALWLDLKFDIEHANDFEKIAMVGDRKWEKMLTDAMKPFTSARVKYFDLSEKEEAHSWLTS